MASCIGVAAAFGFGVLTLKDPVLGGLVFGAAAAAWGFGLRNARQRDLELEVEDELGHPHVEEKAEPQLHVQHPPLPMPIRAYSRELGHRD